jgi:hypothetical protein
MLKLESSGASPDTEFEMSRGSLVAHLTTPVSYVFIRKFDPPGRLTLASDSPEADMIPSCQRVSAVGVLEFAFRPRVDVTASTKLCKADILDNSVV